MLKKVAKLIVGLVAGLVVVAGTRVNADAQTVFIINQNGMYMLDDSDSSLPRGTMAYDILPNWSSTNIDMYSLILNTYGTPVITDISTVNPEQYMNAYLMYDAMQKMGVYNYNEGGIEGMGGVNMFYNPALENSEAMAVSGFVTEMFPFMFPQDLTPGEYYEAMHKIAFAQKHPDLARVLTY